MPPTDVGEFIKSWKLEHHDQLNFARWSGDYNPMHLDAIAARRTHAGAPVGHGVHLLLRALEELYAVAPHIRTLDRVRVDFKKYVFVSQPVSLFLRKTPRGLSAELRTEHGPAVVLKFSEEAGASPSDLPDSLAEIAHATIPREIDLPDMAHSKGWLQPGTLDIADAFPAVAQRLSRDGVAAIAQTSRLVGMVCPGLHSVFSSLEFAVGCNDKRPGLGFCITVLDERTKLVTMDVRGSGIAGSVTAFVRPKPVTMPCMGELANRVPHEKFSNRIALVVGGSRGLGEMTAKMIAAGGGRAVITYVAGKTDAESVADEINSNIGAPVCKIRRLDVTESISEQLDDLSELPTHVYYYATPHIFVQKVAAFDPKLFQHFLRFYVQGMNDVCAFFAERSRNPIAVLYPSSTAVQERPRGMTEYAMAKAAGEILCDDLMKLYPRLKIAKPRLPRTLTDQTATIIYAESHNAVDVVAELLRE